MHILLSAEGVHLVSFVESLVVDIANTVIVEVVPQSHCKAGVDLACDDAHIIGYMRFTFRSVRFGILTSPVSNDSERYIVFGRTDSNSEQEYDGGDNALHGCFTSLVMYV